MILVVVLSYVCSVVPAAAYDMRESSSSSAGRGFFSANCRWWERSSGTVSHYPLRRPSAQTVTPAWPMDITYIPIARGFVYLSTAE
jgi:hypothetical protein